MDGSASDQIRVLWLAKGLGAGGMERLLVNHGRLGDRSKFAYSAAFLVERPHTVIDELEMAGVACYHLGSLGFWDIRWVRRLLRLIRDDRIDVVHIHSPLAAAISRPILRTMRHRPAIVYTEHNSWDNYRTATRVLHGMSLRLDDAHVAVSRPASEIPPRWVGPPAQVLIHGIDVDEVAQHRGRRDDMRQALGLSDRIAIGIVANLRSAKNYPVMLEAARLIVDRDPRVTFVSVGQGPLEHELRSLHVKLRLGDSFRFLGYRKDALDVMAALDIFALSSDVEGLPVAVMEAQALSLPIVATAVGGLVDAIEDGVNGILVPPRRPDLLAEALMRVTGDPELMESLSSASRRSSYDHDARVAVRQLEEIYRQVTD